MRYTIEMEIAQPRATVVALFDDPDNMKRWQPGLVSFEPLDGEPGTEGARARLRYRMGKREMEMVETITERSLPDELVATYETGNVWNKVRNRFLEAGPETTRWILSTEFRFHGLLMRTMGLLAPWAFKRQSRQFMEQFKTFAEERGGHRTPVVGDRA